MRRLALVGPGASVEWLWGLLDSFLPTAPPSRPLLDVAVTGQAAATGLEAEMISKQETRCVSLPIRIPKGLGAGCPLTHLAKLGLRVTVAVSSVGRAALWSHTACRPHLTRGSEGGAGWNSNAACGADRPWCGRSASLPKADSVGTEAEGQWWLRVMGW